MRKITHRINILNLNKIKNSMAEIKITLKEFEIQEKLKDMTLNEMTTVTLNTDALKHNFEVLIEILKALTLKFNGIAGQTSNTADKIKDLETRLEKLETKQEKDNKEVNNKLNETNDTLRETKGDTDKNTSDIQKILDQLKDLKDGHDKLEQEKNSHKEKLDQHNRQIEALMAGGLSSGNNNGGSFDPSALNFLKNEFDAFKDDIEKRLSDFVLKVDFNRLEAEQNVVNSNVDKELKDLHSLLDDFVRNDVFDDFKFGTGRRLDSVDSSITDINNEIEEIKKKLGNKLDCDNFDEHLADYNQLKQIVIALSKGEKAEVPQVLQSSGPSMSTKESNFLKDLMSKFPELEALVKKLQKDLTDHLLNYKDFTENTDRKLTQQDENFRNLKFDTQKKIAELEEMIRKLKDGSSGTNSKPTVVVSPSSSNNNTNVVDHSNDIKSILATLKEHQAKIDELSKHIKGLQGDFGQMKDLSQRVSSLEGITTDHKSRIQVLEDELAELKALKSRVEILEVLIRERDKQHSAPKDKSRKPSVDMTHTGGLNADQVREIVAEECNNLRSELLALIDELRALIDKKADADDLWKSEAALLEKLDQVAGALMKRAQADKSDTKKALIFLEKKIKEITIYLFGDPAATEDGAIFAKKPWNPWTCASCDSKLNQYPGPLIDHKSWNKLPMRQTSPEKMTQGKFGKGWNKWAENKKVTLEKMRDTQTAHGARTTFDTLPEIHKGDPNAHAKQQNEQ